jgi:hypothetical protein
VRWSQIGRLIGRNHLGETSVIRDRQQDLSLAGIAAAAICGAGLTQPFESAEKERLRRTPVAPSDIVPRDRGDGRRGGRMRRRRQPAPLVRPLMVQVPVLHETVLRKNYRLEWECTKLRPI